MAVVELNRKSYEVDEEGFLLDYWQWDEDFAKGTAPIVGIHGQLTSKHWDVIYFIRNAFEEQGRCPLVYEACRANGLKLNDLRKLFPSGYLRGACRLAGLTYKEGYVKYSWVQASDEGTRLPSPDKTYEVDVRGFLMDPEQWDEMYAVHKAHELKMGMALGVDHWDIIRFLRRSYKSKGVIPTVYETCVENNMDLDDLERLFPDGYHRGAVKIAGLRVR
jgi:tRNA 2-thiouridine synthesizing protein E